MEKGGAILRIKRIGVCGIDLHAFEGTQPYFEYPRILGHELSGELVDIDGPTEFQVGERVTFIPYYHCGACIACRNQKPNCCVEMKVCGVHVDGGMTEYLSVPATSLLHGGTLGFDELALVEPLAIGAHGVRRADVAKDEFVLVIGAGPIGLGTMEFVKARGGKVIALDLNKGRLAFCSEKLGIRYIVNAASSDVFKELRDITGGDMPTVVIDATGNLGAINNGFNYLAHGGRYVLIGLQKEHIEVSHPAFHKREATLMSSRNATREDFDQVIEALRSGQINPLTYISQVVPFERVGDEFSQWLDPGNGIIKTIIRMD